MVKYLKFSFLIIGCITALAAVSSAAVLDTVLVADPDPYYEITARDETTPSLQYWRIRVDADRGGVYYFEDLTDSGDGMGGHHNFFSPSTGRSGTMLFFYSGTSQSAVMTRRYSVSGAADRTSFTAAPDGSSFTITYTEDAQSTGFFHTNYSSDGVTVGDGDLLTTVSVTIRPPTTEGTFWDWDIENTNTMGVAIPGPLWSKEFVRTYISNDLSVSSDNNKSLTDGPFNSYVSLSYARFTLGDNSTYGLTNGRQIILDSQEGRESDTIAGTIYDQTWSIFRYLEMRSSFNYAGVNDLAPTATRRHAGQLVIDIPESPAGAPVANAGSDQVINLGSFQTQNVNLDGSASSDDGQIVSYVWLVEGNQIATGATPTISLLPGFHHVELLVTDNDSYTSTDMVDIEIAVSGVNDIYYVDFNDGSDLNSGHSPVAPWRHAPGDAQAVGAPEATDLQPGDMVIFKGGVHYRGQLNLDCIGTSSSPIIYDGNTADLFGQGMAVIDGSEAITGWTPVTNPAEVDNNPNWQSIYKTSMPDGYTILAENIFCDEQLCWMAQDPTPANPWQYEDLTYFNSVEPAQATNTSITDPTFFVQTSSDAWDGAYIYVWGNPNRVYTTAVTSYDPATSTIYFEDLLSQGAGVYDSLDTSYAMANGFPGLDVAGEYVIDEATETVYLLPPAGFDPQTSQASATARDAGFYIDGSEWLIMRGFSILYCRSGVSASSAISPNTTVADSEVAYGGSGMGLFGDGCVISGNYVHDNRLGRGIALYGDDIIISDNTVASNGGTAIYTAGSDNVLISGNVVTDHNGVHANGISLYQGCTDCIVENNISVGGNIALTIQDIDGVIIRNNLFSTIKDSYCLADWSGGIHLSYNVELYNNTILRPASDKIALLLDTSEVVNCVVKNNIIDGGNANSAYGDVSHNLYIGTGFPANETGALHNQDWSQVFVDHANGDYHLCAGSPAIDSAVDISLSYDLEGNTRPQGGIPDRGCYEFMDSNEPPVADAGSDQIVTDTDNNGSENVTLDGSGSSDSDGTIVSYVWTENSTQIATGQTPTVSLGVGVHTIDLTVTDDDNDTDTDTVVITVEAASATQAELTFSWSMESDTPELYPAGSDSTPTYSETGLRTTAESLSGDYSLDISGTYDLASFDNNTNNEVWAAPNEGAISLWWKYTGTFTGNRMLAMIDGKCNAVPALDTNEALKLVCRNNTTQLRLIYGWIDDDGYHTTYITYTHDESWVEDQWYHVVFKWDTDTAPSLFLQIDDNTPVTGGSAIGSFTMEAFHHLLWGNDTADSGDGLYIDDVQVWDGFDIPSNLPPVADAGSDQTVTDTDGNGSQQVSLDGSGSYDLDGYIDTYAWLEDMAQVATGVQPTATLDVGQYTLTLEVTDDLADTDTDTIDVTVVSRTLTSAAAWQNSSLPEKNDLCTVEFDMKPNGAAIDCVTGISYGTASTYSDNACLVRFYTNGEIEAITSDHYESDTQVTYTSGTWYHMRLVIDLYNDTFSIYVTPEGQSEITLGTDYDFHYAQTGVGALDNWSVKAVVGSHEVKNLVIYGD